MNIKEIIKDLQCFCLDLESFWRIFRIEHSAKFRKTKLLGEIIRNTHSIEKGLSLKDVRLGFGLAKFRDTNKVIEEYVSLGGILQVDQILMFMDAMKGYLDFHDEKNFTNKDVEEVARLYESLCKKVHFKAVGKLGGVLKISKRQYSREQKDLLAEVFINRHSVRDFANTPVNEECLRNAIELAMHCPSACNRQCQRLYIVDRKDFHKIDGWLNGTGGFGESLGKLLFVTANMSVYRRYEMLQWVVTGSIFAAYLSLALEIFNIGSCFVQRPILPNKKWRNMASKLNIPEDEQIVCCIGIGNLKETYTVPVSHRLPLDEIVTFVDFKK